MVSHTQRIFVLACAVLVVSLAGCGLTPETAVDAPVIEATPEVPVLSSSPSPTALPSSTTTTPTATPTPTVSPTPSPTSGWIAFVGRDQHLWLTTPDGQTQVPLTSAGQAQSPVWSPDGHVLAYIYQVDEQSPGEVMVYDLSSKQSESLSILIHCAGAFSHIELVARRSLSAPY